MSIVSALASPTETSKAAIGLRTCRLTAVALADASSTATAHRASSTSGHSSKQLTLALTTGYHVGPLFIVRKRRAPLIHGGTLGGKRRRAREVRATPPWVDRAAIRAIYKKAKHLSKSTGEQYVVDHIVPLDGKLVCGLHVPWNLRVIHWLENARKSWHTWPDMPFEQMELSI
jgi:hypothetical protein